MFQGQLYNSVKCCHCGHNHISFDNFLSLSLNLPKEAKHSAGPLELEKCLQDYVKEEQISSAQGYRCGSCKRSVDITKQTVVWRLPAVLVVHLKRFRCVGRRREKLETPVEFPLSCFDLRPFCGKSGKSFVSVDHESTVGAVYDLYGVINHNGSLHFGHYTAYA